jgi:hypothetical protein
MTKVFSRDNNKLHDLVICRGEDKLSTELDGETVILDIASGVYSGIDSVGTAIWNLLENPVSFTTIKQELLENYDVEEEQCINDLLDFLQILADNNLIVVRDE